MEFPIKYCDFPVRYVAVITRREIILNPMEHHHFPMVFLWLSWFFLWFLTAVLSPEAPVQTAMTFTKALDRLGLGTRTPGPETSLWMNLNVEWCVYNSLKGQNMWYNGNPWLINPWFIFFLGGSILVANDHLLGYLLTMGWLIMGWHYTRSGVYIYIYIMQAIWLIYGWYVVDISSIYVNCLVLYSFCLWWIIVHNDVW